MSCNSSLAQLAARSAVNRYVVGSSPTGRVFEIQRVNFYLKYRQNE